MSLNSLFPPIISFSAIADLLGITGKQQGNGFVVANQGQSIGRSLIAGEGMLIENPNGLLGDPRISAAPGRTLLGQLVGADLTLTSDQKIIIPEFARYRVDEIVVTNASATPGAAAGGVYSAPGKGGYNLVANSQGYSGLTDAGVALSLPLALNPQRFLTGPVLYFSLSTPNAAPCTADIQVFGTWLPAA